MPVRYNATKRKRIVSDDGSVSYRSLTVEEKTEREKNFYELDLAQSIYDDNRKLAAMKLSCAHHKNNMFKDEAMMEFRDAPEDEREAAVELRMRMHENGLLLKKSIVNEKVAKKMKKKEPTARNILKEKLKAHVDSL